MKNFVYIILVLMGGAMMPLSGQAEQPADMMTGLDGRAAAPQLGPEDMAADLDDALTFTKYPTYPQYDSMMRYFASTWPEICRLDTIGTSIEGRLLLALKISDNVEEEEDEPALFYSSTIHGDELVGYILSLRLIDFILNNYGENVEIDRIVDDLEIWINPLANPDGAYYPDNDMSVAASRRENVNNIDLNRNYPSAHYNQSDDTTGRQQETKVMMEFMRQIRPNLSANFHSGEEVVNYPWDHKEERHPDNEWFILISREYTDVAHSVDPTYMEGDGFENGITNGYDWYYVYGGRQDYVTYYLQGREVTLELYYNFRAPSESLDHYWNVNQWSLINYITQARYGIHGKVVTAGSGEPVEAKIWVADHDNDSSWIMSDPVTGNFYRYLKEGVYDLVVSSDASPDTTIIGVQVADYAMTELLVELDTAGTRGREGVYAEQFRLFPNPAGNLVTIRSSLPFSNSSFITLYDLTGRKVYRNALPEGHVTFSIPVHDFAEGVYVVEVSKGDGERHTELLKVD